MKKIQFLLIICFSPLMVFCQATFQSLVDQSLEVEGQTLFIFDDELTDIAIYSKNYAVDSATIKNAFTERFFSLPNFESVAIITDISGIGGANDVLMDNLLAHKKLEDKPTLEKRLGQEMMHYLVLPRKDYR